jgi:Helix-turn-helix domain/Rap1a immunity proteins
VATEEVRSLSQEKQLLAHLKRGKSISALNALNLYGCLRLAARVHRLREAGHKIKSEAVKLPSGKRIAMYYLAALLVVTWLPLSRVHAAEAMTVQQLLEDCNESSRFGEGLCDGFVAGIAAMDKCSPSVTFGQAGQIFRNWAMNHPEQWQIQAADGAELALMSVYPCAKA